MQVKELEWVWCVRQPVTIYIGVRRRRGSSLCLGGEQGNTLAWRAILACMHEGSWTPLSCQVVHAPLDVTRCKTCAALSPSSSYPRPQFACLNLEATLPHAHTSRGHHLAGDLFPALSWFPARARVRMSHVRTVENCPDKV